MAKSYYETLGVDRTADEKDIKSAYRRLARKFHPDVNPNDKAAEARFKEISEAYEVVGDPEKRKLYDTHGSNWDQANFEGTDFQSGGFGGVESIFESFFGGRGGGFRMQDVEVMQPRDIEQVLNLTLEEVNAGTTRVLQYQTMDAQRTREGISTVPSTKKVEVKVPVGVGNGKKLRYQGKGAAGANGKSGDLYVCINWLPHDQFRVNGENLEIDVSVPYTTAALGGDVKVKTMRSSISVRIPPGTQSGQSLRLAGQGMSRYGGGFGDMVARVKIIIPKTLSDRERALLEELASLQPVTA